MMPWMYFASRSPRSSKTSSWSSSNSLPIASICSSVSRCRGFSISVVAMRFLSELDLNGALGGVDAGSDHLSALAGHLAGAQVADLAGLQLADAGVADALATSEGEGQSGVLARDEDRLAAVGVRFAVALEEL